MKKENMYESRVNENEGVESLYDKENKIFPPKHMVTILVEIV